MRKHSFGVQCIEEDLKVNGLWFWRGTDLVFKLSDDLQVDYDSYDWRKIDPKSDEAKKLVHKYFCSINPKDILVFK